MIISTNHGIFIGFWDDRNMSFHPLCSEGLRHFDRVVSLGQDGREEFCKSLIKTKCKFVWSQVFPRDQRGNSPIAYLISSSEKSCSRFSAVFNGIEGRGVSSTY